MPDDRKLEDILRDLASELEQIRGTDGTDAVDGENTVMFLKRGNSGVYSISHINGSPNDARNMLATVLASMLRTIDSLAKLYHKGNPLLAGLFKATIMGAALESAKNDGKAEYLDEFPVVFKEGDEDKVGGESPTRLSDILDGMIRPIGPIQ